MNVWNIHFDYVLQCFFFGNKYRICLSCYIENILLRWFDNYLIHQKQGNRADRDWIAFDDIRSSNWSLFQLSSSYAMSVDIIALNSFFVFSRQGPFPLNLFSPAVIGLETIIDLSEQTFVISLLLLDLLLFTKFCVETRSLCDKNCLKCCENH